MKLIADLHIHTIASEHAYSTITEYASYAKKINLPVIGIADHGPAMTDGPKEYYFQNLKILPEKISGTRVLRGAELNIIDDDGKLDLKSHVIKELDFFIASYHSGVIPHYYTSEQLTSGYLKLMEKNYGKAVKILGHIDNPKIPVDMKAVLQAAKETRTLIEINNSSYMFIRPGSYKVGLEMLKLAKKIGNDIIVNTDTHYHEAVGNFELAIKLINETGYPEKLIINSSMERFKKYFKNV